MAKGYFISLEGADGCGKTTQLEHVAEELRRLGREVVCTREPGGTRLAESLRAMVLDPELIMNARTETLLYITARADHVARVIKPALLAGKIVLCDRFSDSTEVYQGIVRGLPLQAIHGLSTFASGGFIQYGYTADGIKRRMMYKEADGSGNPVPTVYCCNVVYENSVGRLLLTEEGYVTLSDKKYHYYLQDHQGNNRVVLSSSGAVEEANHYYPFGGVFASSGNVQPYKYNGKEYDAKKGLNWYDYGARHYDAALGRFTTNDRFAEKYHSMSPYQYGANNPVKHIDVNGDSIVVLNYTSGEHLGLLIQNSSNRWEYYSFNGDKIYNSTEGSLGGGPQDNKGELSWPTPQAFLDSEYNQNTSKEDLESGKVNGYGYQEGYLIPTTEKQDEVIRNEFINATGQGYSLVGNHCSIVVQKSLNKAGIETMNKMRVINRQTGDIFNVKVNPYLPSKAYQAIEKNNPLGYIIRRNK